MLSFYSILAVGSIYILYRYIIFPLFVSPLAQIPAAHWSVPFSAKWFNNHCVDGKTGISAILAAHKNLGPIVRLSPTQVSVASLDGLRKIYSGGFEKDDSYAMFANYDTPNLVSILGNKEHAMQKRMISHVYSKSYIQNSGDVRRISEALVRRIVGLLREGEGRDFDAYGFNHGLGADFMSAYLFGLENATNYMREPKARKRFTQAYRIKFKHLPGETEATEVIESIIMALCQAAEKTNKAGIQSEETTSPVVYSQLSSQLSKSMPTKENELQLRIASEMLDHFLASIETTRITLTYLQWELSRRPDLQSSLRNELLTLSPALNTAQEDLPDPKAIDALPLLDAILTEILRLYPPSPATLTRITPVNGTTVEGYFIPGNITIGTSAQCMHQNASIFKDPQDFKPERWVTKDEDKRKEMNRWLWVFGSGGRMCIGSHYALHCK
jgi:cytochrome P450